MASAPGGVVEKCELIACAMERNPIYLHGHLDRGARGEREGREPRKESKLDRCKKRFFFVGPLRGKENTPTRLLGSLSGMRASWPV